MAETRYDITFTGRVQGVGFRYTTQRVAGGFNVTGWVRNEPDGSVRCIVEGEADEIDRFVESVKSAMSGNIQEAKIDALETTGEFTGFQISYY